MDFALAAHVSLMDCLPGEQNFRTLQDVAGKLETIVPVITLAEFPDAAAAADHAKAVMLAYPSTNAIVIREAGILCWGLMANAQVMPRSACYRQ